MKTFARLPGLLAALFLAASLAMAQQQIQFVGYASQGEGIAAWDADGSGPELIGNGHGETYYYLASRDYVDASSTAAAHAVNILNGFPLFQQALTDNGFTPDQLSMKISLCSKGDDQEGLDWFYMNNRDYSNFYPVECYIELDGHPFIKTTGAYSICIDDGAFQFLESGYMKVINNCGFCTSTIHSIVTAFLNDLDNEEIQFNMHLNGVSHITENGRSGGIYDVNATLTKGLPTLPFQGLHSNHEGFASWDADGTGTEPYGNGHSEQTFYAASLDYDGIDSDPAACLGHIMDGSMGFPNTLLQIQYQGFSIGDLKIKLGLESLGPDIYGEDWVFVNGYHSCNYYNRSIVIEFNGEPILAFMQDTNKLHGLFGISHKFSSASSIGKVYNITKNASREAQFIAQSFLKDVGSRYLKINTSDIKYHSAFSGNGRSGTLYEITDGTLVGVHDKATFIPEGTLSGVWTAESSPYFVDGHQSIENGQTLTIEPGVEVKVRGPYNFDVQGTILAEGTEDQNILFTRSNPDLWWDGFDFYNTPLENDTSKFDYCIFEYGFAQGSANGLESGGAFFIRGFDALTLSNSVFRNNISDGPGSYAGCGGAIGLWNASPMFSKCIFYNNEAKNGGAIFCYNQSDPIVSNCLFYNNYAEDGGAINCNVKCNGIYINNTISDNSADHGGALYFYNHSNPLFINTILWGNQAAISGNQVYNSLLSSKPGFYYCDIEEGHAGFGGQNINGDYLFNIDDDPLFTGTQPFPYALIGSDSPCLNAGTPDTSAWYFPEYLPETCLCGASRNLEGCIDMGAYEVPLKAGLKLLSFDKERDLTIYPNPSTGQLVITYNLPDDALVNLKVYSILGQEVAVIQQERQSAGNYTIDTDLSALKSGLYMVKLDAGEVQSTTKLIIR
ncbi:MAG: T9SS type A sorting domain-containing protein [Lentimicrobium sp.]|jgi:hypothetical protein|nr:T9SS type A sorting domain-containing protein [Lentimicrobium sp.]